MGRRAQLPEIEAVMRSDLAVSKAQSGVVIARPTRVRLLILGLVTLATMINYLDRTVISVAAPLLTRDLGLNAALLGLAFSAFSWTYVAAQIPGGILLDRLGVRLTYYLSVTVWSICTLLQGFSTGLYSLLAARLALGVAEAPAFPCNSRILSTWFPQDERARATGVYSVGQYFGLAFLSPVLFWITAELGWRALFVLVGTLGVLFGFVWLALYRDPGASKQANQAEIDFIRNGGGLSDPLPPARFEWSTIRKLLRQRQVLGASLGQFASNSTLVFFLTWFPTYLATERHMAWLKVGFFAILPFVAATIGVVTGGVLSDFLLRWTGSANIARKLPIVGGLLLASTIVAANFAKHDSTVIAVMSVAFFGQGMCNLGWTLISDVAPKQFIGLTGGIFNLCANLAGIVTPLVVGAIVQATGSFEWALAFIAILAVGGTLSYIFVLGDVRRVEM
jgi:MFS transporter, ACS family, D-galactonate transporter